MFWIAVVPALASVVILVAFVREPERHAADGAARVRLRRSDVQTLSVAYWMVVAVGAVLTLARFSEAFLVLRARETGLEIALVPLVLVVLNVTYAASAYPAGLWSDRAGRRIVLLAGVGVLAVSDVALAAASNIWMVMIGVALWGLHMGLTQGLLATMVTDTAPEALRGTAFGLFNLVAGVATLLASLLAGVLWDRFGPTGTFAAGAILSGLSLIGIAWIARRTEERS